MTRCGLAFCGPTCRCGNCRDASAALGTPASRRTIRRLLRQLGLGRRTARKKKTMGHHPDRNAQFENIGRLRQEYLDAGDPVISIDTKKKELLGNFHRSGTTFTRANGGGQRPRLRQCGPGKAHSARHLRCGQRARAHQLEHQPRHRRTMLRQHRVVVGRTWSAGLPTSCSSADFVRWWRKQQCDAILIQARPATISHIVWRWKFAWHIIRRTVQSTIRSSTVCFRTLREPARGVIFHTAGNCEAVHRTRRKRARG